MMGTEAGLQGGAARAWRPLGEGPAVWKSPKRTVALSGNRWRTGKECLRHWSSVRQPACVADEAPTVCDALCQGTPHCAVRGERRELVPVLEQELALECGIGRVVLRPAGGQRFAVCGHGERMDGKEPEELYGRSADTMGPLFRSRYPCDGLSVEARAESVAHASLASGRWSSMRNSRRSCRWPVGHRVWHPPSRGRPRQHILV